MCGVRVCEDVRGCEGEGVWSEGVRVRVCGVRV